MSGSVISRLDSASFRVVRRGYDRVEVNGFLRSIARDLADAETRSLLDRARPGSDATGRDRSGSVAVAPGADGTSPVVCDVLSGAERQAEIVVEQAEERAREIVAEALAEAARERAEARDSVDRLRAAAAASARELVELGKRGAREELRRACGELERVVEVLPGPWPAPSVPGVESAAAAESAELERFDRLEADLEARIAALQQRHAA